ncbi:MAG: SDR family oxidoreductase [Acidimicrobiales bacterium]|nr:SDR family oxidoreductase [Acidimicrobiales bacterium]
MHELRDRVAVVTGAGRGIGASIAAALADEGVHVVVADIDRQAAEATAATISQKAGPDGVRCVGAGCDVGDLGAVDALADLSWGEFGHVDIVVNNAGIFPPAGPAVDIQEHDARWVIEINLFGVWHGCSVFGKRFVEQGTPAHIVNTGSEHSLGVPHTGAALYTASKHAILGFSDVLRRELPDFVGVSVLCPGMVATDLPNSGLRRPQRFGGPFERGRPAPQPGLAPDEIGRRTVEGIKRGDFYILTHPPVVELAEERWTEVATAFAEQAPRFDGDEALDTRAFIRSYQAGPPRP